MIAAAKEEIPSSFLAWCADPASAARMVNDEKSHQGIVPEKSALLLGQPVCNSTTALGLRGLAALDRIRSRCTGKERDIESGLDNFGARYNSSQMGRFMSPDAFTYAIKTDPQTWNLYSYVANNPLKRTDPDGHDWFLIDNKWQWQKGHKFIDPSTGTVLSTHGYRYLLEFQKTGTNQFGAKLR